MDREKLISQKRKDGAFVVWLLVFSCFYKIAVVDGGIIYKLLSSLVNNLPLAETSRYTDTITIVKLYFIGISLHTFCLFFWLFRERWRIRVTHSLKEECLLLMFAIRMLSEFYIHKGMSAYSFVYDVLCFFVILVFYQIRNDVDNLTNLQLRVAQCIYRIGLLCAIFALSYFFVGLRQDFSAFEFRYFRIGGFMFDAILAGFLYGIGLISAFDLHKQGKIKTVELIVAAILFSIGCLLTGSRGAFYFLAIAIFYFVGSKKSYSKYVFVGMFVVLAIVLYSTFLTEQEVSFVSDGARSYKYSLAFKVFLDHPVTGVGTNMFHYYDTIYGSNPHNLPLTMLAENGAIGFLPYAVWFVSSFIDIVKTKSQYWRWMAISFVVLSMILGTLTNMITVIIMVMVTWACEATKE